MSTCEYCRETDQDVLDYTSDGGPVAHPECLADWHDATAHAMAGTYAPRASVQCPAHGAECYQGEHCPAL